LVITPKTCRFEEDLMELPLFWLLCLALLTVAAQQILSTRFKAKIEARRRIVVAEQISVPPRQYAIPEIVRAFAERSGGKLGGPKVVLAHQRAEMRLAPNQKFFPIEASQLSGTRDPGFVWEATARIAGIVPMRVIDSYAAGRGWLGVRIAGAIPMANATGPENDKGEMMRFLAEMAWNPDAIVNMSALHWREIDDRTVDVLAATKGGTATVRLLFDADGDLEGIEADDRPYLVGGKSLPMRWIGRFRDYADFGSYRLPSYGEVAWVLPEGEFVYWRGTIIDFGPDESSSHGLGVPGPSTKRLEKAIA
jgi:hypothetical protein